MNKLLAIVLLSIGLITCGAMGQIGECAKFRALEDMYKNNKDEAIDEERLLSETRKLALKIEKHAGLPHEPEPVHARGFCNELLSY